MLCRSYISPTHSADEPSLLLVAVAVVIALSLLLPPRHAACEARVAPGPTRPPLVMPDAEHRSRQAPPAERRSGQAASLLPGIQQSHHFTGHRIDYSSPGSERAVESTHQSKLSSVVVNDPFSRTHTAPIRPHRPPGLTRKDAAPRRHDPPGPVEAQFRRLDSSHCCTEHPQLKQNRVLCNAVPTASHKIVFCSLAGRRPCPGPPPYRRAAADHAETSSASTGPTCFSCHPCAFRPQRRARWSVRKPAAAVQVLARFPTLQGNACRRSRFHSTPRHAVCGVFGTQKPHNACRPQGAAASRHE